MIGLFRLDMSMFDVEIPMVDATGTPCMSLTHPTLVNTSWWRDKIRTYL